MPKRTKESSVSDITSMCEVTIQISTGVEVKAEKLCPKVV